MKKKLFITIIMSLAVFFNCFALPAGAVNEEKIISTSVEYFDDGSYLTTTIIEEITNSRANTKTGNKTLSQEIFHCPAAHQVLYLKFKNRCI